MKPASNCIHTHGPGTCICKCLPLYPNVTCTFQSKFSYPNNRDAWPSHCCWQSEGRCTWTQACLPVRELHLQLELTELHTCSSQKYKIVQTAVQFLALGVTLIWLASERLSDVHNVHVSTYPCTDYNSYPAKDADKVYSRTWS